MPRPLKYTPVTFNIVECEVLEAFIMECYGQEYLIRELEDEFKNDIRHHVTGNVGGEYQIKRFARFKAGEVESYSLRLIMENLVKDGFILAGDYLIPGGM